MLRFKLVLGSLLITFGLIALAGMSVQAQIIIVPTPAATGAGNLEPPGSAVNGSGDPVATTQTQPSWNQNLPATERFVRVLPTPLRTAGEGVLDKETGLVWEQSPAVTRHDWRVARLQCMSRTVGDKKGWRLPSVHELGSLMDPGGNLFLPAGHPFSNIVPSGYWSASTNAAPSIHMVPNFSEAWVLSFLDGGARTNLKSNSQIQVWCVRGGGPLSEY